MSSISFNFDECLKCLEEALEWKNFRLGCCYIFSLPCLWICLQISEHSQIPSVCVIYTKSITLHYFLLLFLKCHYYLKLHCSKVVQVPRYPFGVKIIFGIKESIEGFNLKFSIVQGSIQEIGSTRKRKKLCHNISPYC